MMKVYEPLKKLSMSLSQVAFMKMVLRTSNLLQRTPVPVSSSKIRYSFYDILMVSKKMLNKKSYLCNTDWCLGTFTKQKCQEFGTFPDDDSFFMFLVIYKLCRVTKKLVRIQVRQEI